MLKDIILVFLALIASAFIGSLILRILLNGRINLAQAVKSYCIAAALNKLFLTGSGYAAMSWKLKSNSFSLARSLSSFAAFELFSVLPWLTLGFYFGAKIGLEAPLFLAVILALVLFSALWKRREAAGYLKDALGHFRNIGLSLFLIVPLSLANVILGAVYYFFLFRAFGVGLDLWDTLKIASVSFTLGYLSPVPSGLGVKEGGMIYLLAKQGFVLSQASVIAITDRLVMTSFYALAGFLAGGKTIKDEIRKRLKK